MLFLNITEKGGGGGGEKKRGSGVGGGGGGAGSEGSRKDWAELYGCIK